MIDLGNLPNHERDEVTKLFLRRHWISLVSLGFTGLALLCIPAFFYATMRFIGWNFIGAPTLGIIAGLLLSTYLLLVTVILMTQFTDYYLDTWIVTNCRIINIELQGLFSRTISELHLNQIQDVTSETIGMLPTFLSYGNVYIQTAGTRERFNFQNVDNPEDVKELIIELSDDDKRRHGDASSDRIV
ncbi:MAG: PH domain-containing protein [Patescibacteria group bacterium]